MKRMMFLMVIVTILSSSCGVFQKLSAPVSHEPVIEQLGDYVRSAPMPKRWHQGKTTIIYMADTTCIVIWGDGCDYTPGESLYAKSVWWSTIGSWKSFLVNDGETIKYSLLKPEYQ